MGAALCDSPKVQALSFTGSTAVGRVSGRGWQWAGGLSGWRLCGRGLSGRECYWRGLSGWSLCGRGYLWAGSLWVGSQWGWYEWAASSVSGISVGVGRCGREYQ